MNNFLVQKNQNKDSFSNGFRKLKSRKKEKYMGLLSKTSRLMVLAEKGPFMSKNNKTSKINYKNGATQIKTENETSVLIILMSFDLIIRWIFRFAMLLVALRFPAVLALLIKIVK